MAEGQAQQGQQFVTVREFDILYKLMSEHGENTTSLLKETLTEVRKTNGRVTALETRAEVTEKLATDSKASNAKLTAGITVITTGLINGIIAAISAYGGGK